MRSGQLTNRITIQSATETNTGGSLSRTWATFAERWAEPLRVGGREYSTAIQQVPEMAVLFRCRGYLAVTEKMRVVFDGQTFDILSAYSPSGRACVNAAEVWLACKESAGDGQ